ncbi:MAG: caspase family protein, partial [Bacteroidota bacterium]
MKTLYALLTGICRYHPQSKNVPPLKGCENDVNAWKAFLEKNYGTAYRLEIKTLLNDQATWQNVVEHLGDKHLGKAGKDDVALFYYSGHGSRQRSAAEFLPFFPDGWDETLVLHDSRVPGGKDLADKELAVLLHQLGQKTQNLVVLLDCCHSGSGTRAAEAEIAAKRQSPDSTTPRDFNSYLFGWYARNFPGGQNISLPSSRHILLAACDRKEVAYELKNDQGLFSYSLIGDLEKNGVNVSYAQLFTRCRHAMMKVFKNQHPQFEAVNYFNAHELFLSPGGAAKPSFIAGYNKEKSIWEVNCGALQGLPTEPDKQAKFAIYEKGEKKGHATAVRTRLQKCEVQLDFTPSMLTQYQAELISLPAAKMPVKLVRLGGGDSTASSAKPAAIPVASGRGVTRSAGLVQPISSTRS